MSRAEKAERLIVFLVAAHTLAVGGILAFLPRFAVRFAGWGEVSPLFFPRQAGAFHFVLAFGYFLEYFRCRGVALLLAAKAMAALFLFLAAGFSDVPWAVPFSGAADGLMGAAVWYLHHRAETTRRAVLPAVNP